MRAVDESGLTALHRAAQKAEGAAVARILLDAGVEIEAANVDRYTALHVACMRGHAQLVRLLLEHGADPRATTADGDTPLDLLKRHGHAEADPALADALYQALDRLAAAEPRSSPPSPPSSPVAPPSLAWVKGKLLVELPSELMIEILSRCDTPSAILTAAATCRQIHSVALSDAAWRAAFEEHFSVVVQYAFGGVCQAPPTGECWLSFYQRFAVSWMERAYVERGLVLTVIDGRCFDVGGFLDDHPGDKQLLIAAAGRDATEAFEYIEHSSHARRLMEAMAVPALDGCARLSLLLRWRSTRPTKASWYSAAGTRPPLHQHIEGWLASTITSASRARSFLVQLSCALDGRMSSTRRMHAIQLLN